MYQQVYTLKRNCPISRSTLPGRTGAREQRVLGRQIEKVIASFAGCGPPLPRREFPAFPKTSIGEITSQTIRSLAKAPYGRLKSFLRILNMFDLIVDRISLIAIFLPRDIQH